MINQILNRGQNVARPEKINSPAYTCSCIKNILFLQLPLHHQRKRELTSTPIAVNFEATSLKIGMIWFWS